MVFVRLGDFVLTLVVIPGFAGVSFLHKLLQLPLPDELFFLLLQVSTIFSVIAMVFVEEAIFSLVAHIG